MSNFPIAVLQETRERKQAEMAELTSKLRLLKTEIQALEQAIGALGANVSAAPVRDSGKEPLKLLIAKTLESRPGLNPAEIASALTEAGRPTDVNTVLGTLSRAKKEGLIRKEGRVWFATKEPPQQSIDL